MAGGALNDVLGGWHVGIELAFGSVAPPGPCAAKRVHSPHSIYGRAFGSRVCCLLAAAFLRFS